MTGVQTCALPISYNVGTGEDTTIAQLHDAAAAVAGIESRPRFEDARLGDILRSVLDPALIERQLGWSAQVSLDEGLRRTWAWMKEQGAT